MKIGILQADSVLPQLRAEFGDYPNMFQSILSAAARLNPPLEVEFVTYDVEHLEYPDHLSDCDAYLITGSQLSVYDNEAWIHKLSNFVIELHEARARLIGICFGHQLIAMALGGLTEPAKAGWAVGIRQSRLLTHKAYMQPPLEKIQTIVSHKDQVSILPQDAELLAESDYCPYGAYQIDNHILSFQGHIEFTKGYSRVLMNLRRKLLGDALYNSGIESLTLTPENLTLARWVLNFIAN